MTQISERPYPKRFPIGQETLLALVRNWSGNTFKKSAVLALVCKPSKISPTTKNNMLPILLKSGAY